MPVETPVRRHYDDACATAHALDLVGERWALLVMRELMLGPKRFSDLRADLPGISANVLTQRLEGLEAEGIVVRRRLPPPAAAQVYELTPWGYESEPIFQALGRWAARSPTHDPSLPFSAVSLFLSFRTMFDPARAKGLRARIGFRFGAESFVVRIANGRLEVARGPLMRLTSSSREPRRRSRLPSTEAAPSKRLRPPVPCRSKATAPSPNASSGCSSCR